MSNIATLQKEITQPDQLIQLKQECYIYQIRLDSPGDHYWGSHQLDGQWCLPAVMNIQAIISFQKQVFPDHFIEINQLFFKKMAVLDTLQDAIFHCTFRPEKKNRWLFTSFLLKNGQMQELATAVVLRSDKQEKAPLPINVSTQTANWKSTIHADALYDKLAEIGYNYGCHFQWLSSGLYHENITIRKINPPETHLQDEQYYSLYPGLIDSCMQCFNSSGSHDADYDGGALVPFYIERITLHNGFDRQQKAWVYAKDTTSKRDSNTLFSADIMLFHHDCVVFQIAGLKLIRKPNDTAMHSAKLYSLTWHHELKPIEKAPKVDKQTLLIQFGGQSAYSDQWLLFSEAFCQDDLTLMNAMSCQLTPIMSKQTRASLILYFPSSVQINQPSQCLRVFLKWLQKHQHHSVSITVVTLNGQYILPSDSIDPVQSQLWGLVRVIRHEKPRLELSLIDIEYMRNFTEIKKMCRAMPEWQVAIRNETTYFPRLLPSHFQSKNTLQYDSNKTYIIVGGTGGLGLIMSEFLAGKGVKNILLIGRSGKVANQKIVDQLIQSGVNVQIITTDVTDNDHLTKTLFNTARNVVLGGLIFAVGLTDDGVIENQTRESFDKVMLPKMQGLHNIWSLFSQSNLDFFAVFSSISSTFGTHGQSHYAGANAFLDSYCYASHAKFPVITIGWGPWSNIGIAANQKPHLNSIFNHFGIQWISPEQGRKLFDISLSSQSGYFLAGCFNIQMMRNHLPTDDIDTWLSQMK